MWCEAWRKTYYWVSYASFNDCDRGILIICHSGYPVCPVVYVSRVLQFYLIFLKNIDCLCYFMHLNHVWVWSQMMQLAKSTAVVFCVAWKRNIKEERWEWVQQQGSSLSLTLNLGGLVDLQHFLLTPSLEATLAAGFALNSLSPRQAFIC